MYEECSLYYHFLLLRPLFRLGQTVSSRRALQAELDQESTRVRVEAMKHHGSPRNMGHRNEPMNINIDRDM